jgi:hypothetical protein
MSEIDVSFRLTREQALEFATRLARDDDFRAQLATSPQLLFDEYDITISSSEESTFTVNLPPKHAVEDALVNIAAASPFGRDGNGQDFDRLGYWPFFIFIVLAT